MVCEIGNPVPVTPRRRRRHAPDKPQRIFHCGGGEEAIESGSFWFYYKLGFRPESPEVARLDANSNRLPCKPASHASCDVATAGSIPAVYAAADLGEAVLTHVRKYANIK